MNLRRLLLGLAVLVGNAAVIFLLFFLAQLHSFLYCGTSATSDACWHNVHIGFAVAYALLVALLYWRKKIVKEWWVALGCLLMATLFIRWGFF